MNTSVVVMATPVTHAPSPGAPVEAPHRDPVLDSLSRLANAVAAAPDLRAVYRALYAFAEERTPTSAIFVALYDAVRQQRICVYSAGDGIEDDVSSLPPMAMSGSPQSRAITTGQPILTDDLEAALAGKPVVTLGSEQDPRMPQSSLAVPLIVLGRTIGAFEVQSMEFAAYTLADVVAMRLAADIAALATDSLRSTGNDTARSEHDAIRRIIDTHAFTVVFQPIVELASGRTVGFEALTRFTDGTPPDVRFIQACAAGLGLELEERTLMEALAAAASLPADVALHLNVSPRLVLLAGDSLAALVRQHRGTIVLELTEHVVVEDYVTLRSAIGRLGTSVRVAVDDAGAGFASLRHILELGPQFVKLDRTIVAGIDADPARRALVAGMQYFARSTRARLVAEGIETVAELRALQRLGVTQGQGYYLGRPAPLPPGGRPRPGSPYRPTTPARRLVVSTSRRPVRSPDRTRSTGRSAQEAEPGSRP